MKNIQAIYPLAPSQLGMLLESLSSPQQGLHIEQLSCVVHGAIELEHFQKAWQLVIERHGIFRTAFVAKDRAEPLQVVLQQVSFTVSHEDWSALDPSTISDKLNVRLKNERELGFNLTRPPLMRVGLFKVRPEQFQFVWTVHHILLDGWCLPLVLNEVIEFYSACSTGKLLRIPPAGQYGDYVDWLRRQSLPPAETFWKGELSNFNSTTAFGEESSASESPSTGVAQCKFELPVEIAKSFRAHAGGLGVSIPVVLQCLWALVMARLSGKDDVVFGMTVSGRPADLPRVETIVGLFINTIPARFNMDPKVDFWNWTSAIQIRQNARRSFEYVSSGQIHLWSGFSGSTPLYETLLVVENSTSPDTSPRPIGFQVETLQSAGARTHHPITLLLSAGEKIQGEFIYDQSRITSSGIAQIIELIAAAANLVSQKASNAQITRALQSLPRPHVRKRSTGSVCNSIAPRDLTELRLAELWETLLQQKPIGVKDDFFALGGHSLLVLQLRSKVESVFGVALPLVTFVERPTVEQQAIAIRNSSKDFSTLVAINARGNKPPLVCFHPLGGGVLNYMAFARHLDSEQPVYALQACGLEKGQKALNTIRELAALYANEINLKFPGIPVALAGFSFGGLVAFETASILVASGREILSLALFDTPAPHVVPAAIQSAGPAALLVSLFSPGMPLLLEELLPLSPDAQLRLVHQRCLHHDLLPSEVTLEDFTRIFAVWSRFYDAAMNYHPQPCPIHLHLFRASEDSRRVSNENALGWDSLAEAVTVHWVSGRHEDMDQEPHVIQLAQAWQKANDAPNLAAATSSPAGTSGF